MQNAEGTENFIFYIFYNVINCVFKMDEYSLFSHKILLRDKLNKSEISLTNINEYQGKDTIIFCLCMFLNKQYVFLGEKTIFNLKVYNFQLLWKGLFQNSLSKPILYQTWVVGWYFLEYGIGYSIGMQALVYHCTVQNNHGIEIKIGLIWNL
jgi:hypothetical protein